VRVDPREPPRRFQAAPGVEIEHVADIELEPDEQVTFTAAGTEWDVVRKDWGYYATPSLNRRLRDHGLRAALTANPDGRVALLLVEPAKQDAFESYCEEQSMRVLAWLDGDDAAEALG
jgi:hypothetical protein